jgi:hypothetical protein
VGDTTNSCRTCQGVHVFVCVCAFVCVCVFAWVGVETAHHQTTPCDIHGSVGIRTPAPRRHTPTHAHATHVSELLLQRYLHVVPLPRPQEPPVRPHAPVRLAAGRFALGGGGRKDTHTHTCMQLLSTRTHCFLTPVRARHCTVGTNPNAAAPGRGL